MIHEKTIVKPKEATEKDLLVVHSVQYLKDLKVRWHFILAVISRIVHYIYHDFIKNRWIPAVGYLCTCLTCILNNDRILFVTFACNLKKKGEKISTLSEQFQNQISTSQKEAKLIPLTHTHTHKKKG